MMRGAIMAAVMGSQMRAGLISLEQTLQKVLKQNNILPTNSTNIHGPGLRNLPETQTQSFDAYLKPYGCWCYFQQDEHSINHGRGEPVDIFDSLCKRLQEMYECVVIDAEERGEQCHPWEVQYNIEDEYLFDSGDALNSGTAEDREKALTETQWWCRETQGRDLCKRDVCQVELTFIIDLWANVIAETAANDQSDADNLSSMIDTRNFHENGFDRDLMCIHQMSSTQVGVLGGNGDPNSPSSNGGNGGNGNSENVPFSTDPQEISTVSVEKKCCGNHPFRAPYKTHGGQHQCCEAENIALDWDDQPWNIGKGKTYSPAIHVCCEDGSVKSIGDDC